MKYIVSMKVDARVDVTVDADSAKEAFRIAQKSDFDWNDCELVDYCPVNVTDEHGHMEDYNG